MRRPGSMSERSIALLLLAVLAFVPPFLAVFDRPVRPFGVPLLYLYLFVAWAAIVGLIALVAERGGRGPPERGESAEEGREP